MKIFHISDTHLGFSAFAKLDPESGLNQREADFYGSFGEFVEISLKRRPDIVLHTGDLFDSVRPSNRAISFALTEIKKLSDAGIGFVAISGNHETPRLRETGNVFRILDHLQNCQFIYDGGLKRIVKNDLEILAIPHTGEDQFKKDLEQARNLDKQLPRLMMMHVGLLGVGVFRMNEMNELTLDFEDIDSEADYVALGHYHDHVDVSNNCSYAGSTERLSIAEAKGEKGFLEVDLDAKKRTFIRLSTRSMIDIPALNLHGSSASDATKEIIHKLDSSDIEGAIVRMTIKGISKEVRGDIDINRIRKITQRALNLELTFQGKEEDKTVQGESPHIGQLDEEFKRYLLKASIGGLDRKRIEREAMDLFAEREE